jgi:regulator of protease activity HflC (stomatin/prohibitin superfamily)
MQVDHALEAAAAARAAREDEAARRRAAEARIAELESTIESLQGQLEVVYGSRSWKLTAPLRATRPGRRGSTL